MPTWYRAYPLFSNDKHKDWTVMKEKEITKIFIICITEGDETDGEVVIKTFNYVG